MKKNTLKFFFIFVTSIYFNYSYSSNPKSDWNDFIELCKFTSIGTLLIGGLIVLPAFVIYGHFENKYYKKHPEEYLLKLQTLKFHSSFQSKKDQEYLDKKIAETKKKIAEQKNNSSCSENMTTMDTENKDIPIVTQLKRDKDRDHESETHDNRDFFFDRMRYIDPAENNILHLIHSFHPRRSTNWPSTNNWYTKTVLSMFKHISNQQKIPTPQLSHDTHNPFYYFCP